VTVYQGGDQDLLINTIGVYQGERPLSGQEPVMLDIQADGAWTVEVRPVGVASSAEFSGAGDAVSAFFSPPPTSPWEIRHNGQRNFIIYAHCAGGNDLVQNEIGPVSGSRVLSFPEGPCLWEVQADGTWSLSSRPTDASISTTVPAPTATAISAAPYAAVGKVVNLRSGPGTNYPAVSAAKAGEQYAIEGRNQDGSWLEVCCVDGESVWVSKSVVQVVGDANTITVAKNIPPTPIPSPTSAPAPDATAVPAKNADFGSAFPQIGQEVEAGGWRFKVTEAHKRKAVYFYDNSYIAQGHFLILVIEATNLHPGTSYFANDLAAYITDVPANTYDSNWKGSSYAQWMLGGADSIYTDVNPGVAIRMVVAYDLPDNLGDILLSGGKASRWIYLGNFAWMPSEDS
jgi:uncharacterized protein YraI